MVLTFFQPDSARVKRARASLSYLINWLAFFFYNRRAAQRPYSAGLTAYWTFKEGRRRQAARRRENTMEFDRV